MAVMDGSRLSPYPHLSWLVNGLVVRQPRVFLLHEYKAVSHRLVVSEEGDADLVWTTDGADVPYHVTAGDLGFFPCDSGTHVLGITAAAGYRGHEVLVPTRHLERVRATEDLPPLAGFTAIPVFRDTLMLASLLRLLAGSDDGYFAQDIGAEIAARQVIMQLCGAIGVGRPDWLADASVFTPPVMRRIVERVDERLCSHPSLETMSSGFGLSPSHFARKFQLSTGLSLNRFINRRRIGLALVLLRSGRQSLAQLSLDLGFYSQSHFTRLFSGLTGVTPYQFRRAHHRMGD
jgi:AraC-like DNA-binding protein